MQTRSISLIAALFLIAPPALALPTEEAAQITRVIEAQRADLADREEASSYASLGRLCVRVGIIYALAQRLPKATAVRVVDLVTRAGTFCDAGPGGEDIGFSKASHNARALRDATELKTTFDQIVTALSVREAEAR